MTQDLYLLNVQDPFSLVKKIFEEHEFRHLPVVRNHEVVGIVDRNVLRLLNIDSIGSLKPDLRAEDFMYKNPLSVHEDETISSVAKKFTEEKAHALPVINHEGITGIVTTTDIISFLRNFGISRDNNESDSPKEQLR